MNKPELHQAINETLPQVMPNVPEGSYLARWVLVAEVVLPEADASRSICRLTSDAANHVLTPWDVRGLLHQALAMIEPTPMADRKVDPPPF